MSEDPKQDYEAPKVEALDAADGPAVTAAGESNQTDFQQSDRRLKHSLRALHARITRSR